MIVSRVVLRVVLTTIAVGGVVVTYGATQNALRASSSLPDCNCHVTLDCGEGKGWKCNTSEPDLCLALSTGCGTLETDVCDGYCERVDGEGGQPK